jgi:hypothetical protein
MPLSIPVDGGGEEKVDRASRPIIRAQVLDSKAVAWETCSGWRRALFALNPALNTSRRQKPKQTGPAAAMHDQTVLVHWSCHEIKTPSRVMQVTCSAAKASHNGTWITNPCM